MSLAKNSHEGRADRLVVDAAETRRVLETLLGGDNSHSRGIRRPPAKSTRVARLDGVFTGYRQQSDSCIQIRAP